MAIHFHTSIKAKALIDQTIWEANLVAALFCVTDVEHKLQDNSTSGQL